MLEDGLLCDFEGTVEDSDQPPSPVACWLQSSHAAVVSEPDPGDVEPGCPALVFSALHSSHAAADSQGGTEDQVDVMSVAGHDFATSPVEV